jgi:hypothetical protein
MAKTAKTKAKAVAKKSAGAVQSVMADALGAAAATAAGVVLTRVAEGMGAGSKKVEKATPALKTTAKHAARKSLAKMKKTVRKKATAPKKRRKK